MRLRHLRYFVATAEHGSITRAAEALHMEQAPLSQQLKQFEETLGVQLFQRLVRGVRLTAIGSELLSQARVMLALEEKFLFSARSLARGELGHVRIGLAGGIAPLPMIPETIRRFKRQRPGVTVFLEDSNTTNLCRALDERSVDVAIIRPPPADSGALSVHPLFQETTVAAVAKDHPLAHAKRISLAALREEPFIIFPRDFGPGYHDAIFAACRDAGFTPRLGQQASQIMGMVPMAAAGLGVAIIPKSLSSVQGQEAAFLALDPPAPVAEVAIAVRADHHSPLVDQLCRAFLELIGQNHPAG